MIEAIVWRCRLRIHRWDGWTLTLILSKTSMFGQPEKFKSGEHEKGIGNRSGIVSFFHLMPGVYENGHIDLVMPQAGGAKKCASDCWWSSKEVWFWALT